MLNVAEEFTSMLKCSLVWSSRLTETINFGWLLWHVFERDAAFGWLEAVPTSIKLSLFEHLLHLTSNILLKYLQTL